MNELIIWLKDQLKEINNLKHTGYLSTNNINNFNGSFYWGKETAYQEILEYLEELSK